MAISPTAKTVWRRLSIVVVLLIAISLIVDVVAVYGATHKHKKSYTPACVTKNHQWTARESGVTIGQLVVHSTACWNRRGNLIAPTAITQSYFRSKTAELTGYKFTGTGIYADATSGDQYNERVTGHAQLCPGLTVPIIGPVHVCAFDERFELSAIMNSPARHAAHGSPRWAWTEPGPYGSDKGYHLTWSDDG